VTNTSDALNDPARPADTRGVMRRLLVLPLLAALLVLPGCFWWVAPMAAMEGGSESSSSSSEEAGRAAVRASIPALEAYYADNGTYKGASLEVLQQRYDAGIHGIRIVKANDQTYCVESTFGAFAWHKAGPSSEVMPGNCQAAAVTPLPPQTDADMCIESTINGMTYYQVGSAGRPQPGHCP
jgi:hypothetical protein